MTQPPTLIRTLVTRRPNTAMHMAQKLAGPGASNVEVWHQFISMRKTLEQMVREQMIQALITKLVMEQMFLRLHGWVSMQDPQEVLWPWQ